MNLGVSDGIDFEAIGPKTFRTPKFKHRNDSNKDQHVQVETHSSICKKQENSNQASALWTVERFLVSDLNGSK